MLIKKEIEKVNKMAKPNFHVWPEFSDEELNELKSSIYTEAWKRFYGEENYEERTWQAVYRDGYSVL